MENYVKAVREYKVEFATLSRCDICKRFFRTAYDFIPVHKNHNFDNVVVCSECLKHLPGFTFNMQEVEQLNEQRKD